MGISHEYDHARRRSRQRSRYGKLKALGAAAAILLLSAAITAILETARQETAPALPEALPAGTVEGILAPLPMQPGQGGGAAAEVLAFGPNRQSPGAYTVRAYDSSVIRQPAAGQVDLAYFADAAFLGAVMPQDGCEGRCLGFHTGGAFPSGCGHTGFTGTCAWADPDNRLIFVFLCNRTYPDPWNTTLTRLDLRTRMQEMLYRALRD